MSTGLAYWADPFRWEFEAEVVSSSVLPDGRTGVLLASTYFYPTGGGQEHDTGTLGDAQVTDVILDDDGNVFHIVDRALAPGKVAARIDGARRFAFMQSHSGQHLLSAALVESLDLATLSAHISIDSPCTIDLPLRDLSERELAAVETLANSIIYADRPVRSYMVSESQIHTIPLRRPPKVSGEIRIVEIEDYDYSACGGTHCTRTGMIGLVKILKTERRGDKLRVHFACGGKALELFQQEHAIMSATALTLGTGVESIPAVVERQSETVRALEKELQELGAQRLVWQAEQLVAAAEPLDGVKLVTATLNERSPQELRALASALQQWPGVIALLAAYDGRRLTLAVTCASDTRVSANALIRKQLAEIGGRGGGDAQLAQGGGPASAEQFATLFARAREYIHEIRGANG